MPRSTTIDVQRVVSCVSAVYPDLVCTRIHPAELTAEENAQLGGMPYFKVVELSRDYGHYDHMEARFYVDGKTMVWTLEWESSSTVLCDRNLQAVAVLYNIAEALGTEDLRIPTVYDQPVPGPDAAAEVCRTPRHVSDCGGSHETK